MDLLIALDIFIRIKGSIRGIARKTPELEWRILGGDWIILWFLKVWFLGW